MINGTFQNCYGLKSFELNNIRFDTCKAALIYAPNGVMKSSLAFSKLSSVCSYTFSKTHPANDHSIPAISKSANKRAKILLFCIALSFSSDFISLSNHYTGNLCLFYE